MAVALVFFEAECSTAAAIERVKPSGQSVVWGRTRSTEADQPMSTSAETIANPLTRAEMQRLAAESPHLLISVLESDRRTHVLSAAAEIIGAHAPGEWERLVVPLLLRLLCHSSAFVRERAIYGLAYHRSTAVDPQLASVAANDPSPGVREAAEEALNG